MQQVIRHLRARREECFFWATHAGAELDLLIVRGTQRLGFEFKRNDAPKVTASMHSAMETLKLKRLAVIHAGTRSFDLRKNIRAIASTHIGEEVIALR